VNSLFCHFRDHANVLWMLRKKEDEAKLNLNRGRTLDGLEKFCCAMKFFRVLLCDGWE